MKKLIVVIGLGRLGESIAKTLVKIGHEVLALDQRETLVRNISFVTHAVQTDLPVNLHSGLASVISILAL